MTNSFEKQTPTELLQQAINALVHLSLPSGNRKDLVRILNEIGNVEQIIMLTMTKLNNNEDGKGQKKESEILLP